MSLGLTVRAPCSVLSAWRGAVGSLGARAHRWDLCGLFALLGGQEQRPRKDGGSTMGQPGWPGYTLMWAEGSVVLQARWGKVVGSRAQEARSQLPASPSRTHQVAELGLREVPLILLPFQVWP